MFFPAQASSAPLLLPPDQLIGQARPNGFSRAGMLWENMPARTLRLLVLCENMASRRLLLDML